MGGTDGVWNAPVGDHDLIRLVDDARNHDPVGLVGLRDLVNATVQHHGKRKMAGVLSDLISTGVAIRITGKGKPRETAVPGGCEEPQGFPTAEPRRCRLILGVQDGEIQPLLGKEVPDCQSGLTTANHRYVASNGTVPGVCTRAARLLSFTIESFDRGPARPTATECF
jgi:hypothetical protein